MCKLFYFSILINILGAHGGRQCLSGKLELVINGFEDSLQWQAGTQPIPRKKHEETEEEDKEG